MRRKIAKMGHVHGDLSFILCGRRDKDSERRLQPIREVPMS